MDVSSFFSTCVKVAALYNTKIKFTNNIKIKHKSKKKDLFNIKTCSITKQIKKLFELLENHQTYLSVWKNLFHKHDESEICSDQIDFVAPNIIRFCLKLIEDLKVDVAIRDLNQHHQEHQEIVILMLEEYLQHVSNIYIEQKSIRLKRMIKLRKSSKLNFSLKHNKIVNQSIETDCTLSNDSNTLDINKSNTKVTSLIIQEINGDVSQTYYEDEKLSPEDVQMFEVENELIHHELNTIAEEIRQIETKVIHISELQEIFMDRILDQDRNLENVLTTVVGSTENVIEANEHIRKAIQRNAGLRAWILFFLILMSFTLIFLDWYNP